MSEQTSKGRLSTDKISGLISSLQRKGKLDADSLSSKIVESGGPQSQAIFLGGIMTQIEEDLEMKQLRLEDEKNAEEIRALRLQLAGRLNLLADYLVASSPEERKNILSVADRLGQIKDKDSWKKIRLGLVGTVGAYILLSQSIVEPVSFPTPEEDVDSMVDLKTQTTLIQLKVKKGPKTIQVYTHPNQLRLATEKLISTQKIASPGAKQFVQRLRQEAADFQILADYATSQSKDPAFVVIPPGEIDFRTCEPIEKYDHAPIKQLLSSVSR